MAWQFELLPMAVTVFGALSSSGYSFYSVTGKEELRKTEQVGAATLVLFSEAVFC